MEIRTRLRHAKKRLGVLLWLFVGGLVLAGFGLASAQLPSVGAATAAVAKPLSASDLPPGFKTIVPPLVPPLCAALDLPDPGQRHLTIGFQSASLSILEALTVPKSVRTVYRELVRRYTGCKTVRPVRGLEITGTGKRLAMAQIGDQSQAFSFNLSVNDSHINEELVVFRKSFSCGIVEFVSAGPLDVQQFELVASIAAAKADSVIAVPTVATRAPVPQP